MVIILSIFNWLLLFGSGYLLQINDRNEIFWMRINLFLQRPRLSFFDTPEILIILGYLLIVINLIINIVTLVRKKVRKKKKIRKVSSLNLIVSFFTFIFLVVIYFLNSNYSNCNHFFQLCKDGWHYENNSLGQKVDVHYKTDLQGKKLADSFIGCGYDGTPDNYHVLIMTLPGVKIVEDNENQRIYQLLNGTKGYLNKKNKPYVDRNLDLAVGDLMYSGTSCEEIRHLIIPIQK